MSIENFKSVIELCQVESTDFNLISEMSARVATSGNPYFICDFTEMVPGADTPENMKILEDAIIATGDIVHIYEFMFLMVDSKIQNFDLTRFEDLIIASNNPKLMYYIMGYVPGVNRSKLLEAIGKTKSQKYLEHVKEIVPVPEPVYNAAILHDYFPDSLSDFFETKNVSQLRPIVIAMGIPYYINELAEYLADRNEDISDLQVAMLKTGDILHIYEFACSVSGVNLDVFEEVIINSGMAKYMYYMFEYLEGTNKERLKAAILATGNQKYIEKVGGTLDLDLVPQLP